MNSYNGYIDEKVQLQREINECKGIAYTASNRENIHKEIAPSS